MIGSSDIKLGFIIKNEDSNEALYFSQGKLCYGTNYSAGDLVYFYIQSEVGFLVADNKILFIIGARTCDSKTAICELSSRQFLSSNPSQRNNPGGANFNREKVSSWEQFTTEKISEIPSWLDYYFLALSTNSIDLVFDRISAGHHVDIPFLSYILGTNNGASVDKALIKRLDDNLFLQGVLKLASGNYLITPLINGILDGGNDNRPIVIGQDRDIYGRGIDIRNPWLIINTAIRRNIRKLGKCCIVATARNEGVYLTEWIAYHLELGFEKIFLYTNNNQDGSLDLLRALHSSGHIELIESDVGGGGNAQVKAYTHALLAHAKVNTYEWCAFIDVDEFISYDKARFHSLADYMNWVGATGADVVALSWVLASNHIESSNWTHELVTKRITRRSPFQSNLIKCIARPEKAVMSGPHYPISSNGCALAIVDSERRRYDYERLDNPFDITRAATPTFKNLYLYHFEMKSFAELIWKYSRNRGNYSAVNDDIHLNDHFMDRVGHFRKCLDNGRTEQIHLSVDTNILDRKIEDLMAQNGVSAANNTILRLTDERYQRLLQYLPIYLKTQVSETRLHPARDWISINFLDKTP